MALLVACDDCGRTLDANEHFADVSILRVVGRPPGKVIGKRRAALCLPCLKLEPPDKDEWPEGETPDDDMPNELDEATG